MDTTLPGLDRIAEPMRPAIRQFAALLEELAQDQEHGLTLYGTLAAGRFDATRHTVRSVWIVQDVDLAALRKLADDGPRLGGLHLAAPLIMTPTYIDKSRDTFPLELIDIQQNHVVIFGEDRFSGLVFDPPDVRHQCERESKSLLIGLRQGLLAAAGRDAVLLQAERQAGEQVLRVMRGMLWLKGQRDGQPGEAVIEAVENLLDLKLRGIRGIIDLQDGQTWTQFQECYRDIETLGAIVDAW